MKAVRIIIFLLFLAIIGALVAGFVVDEMTSANIESALNAIPVPRGATIESSVHKTGKITIQNGALQYYGAILIQSTDKLGTLRSYYKSHQPEGLDIEVINLADSVKTFGDKMDKTLRFSHHDKSPENYYIVYAFGEAQMPFPMLDIRSYT